MPTAEHLTFSVLLRLRTFVSGQLRLDVCGWKTVGGNQRERERHICVAFAAPLLYSTVHAHGGGVDGSVPTTADVFLQPIVLLTPSNSAKKKKNAGQAGSKVLYSANKTKLTNFPKKEAKIQDEKTKIRYGYGYGYGCRCRLLHCSTSSLQSESYPYLSHRELYLR